MKTYAIEYRTMTGRIKCTRVDAPNREAAMDAAVERLLINFADLQSIEERGA